MGVFSNDKSTTNPSWKINSQENNNVSNMGFGIGIGFFSSFFIFIISTFVIVYFIHMLRKKEDFILDA